MALWVLADNKSNTAFAGYTADGKIPFTVDLSDPRVRVFHTKRSAMMDHAYSHPFCSFEPIQIASDLDKGKAMKKTKTKVTLMTENKRRLGRSQQAVWDWLSKQEQAQTAWDVGNALYDDVSMCSKKNSRWHSTHVWEEEKIRTSWARKVLREMVKNGSVLIQGVAGTARTYVAN